ncbi:MAG: DUF5723 family protein [Pedobacter sp.]
MKKSTFLMAAFCCLTAGTFAQDLPGFRTSSYNGVLGVYGNPANVAQNNYSWDVSLLSFGVGIGNNNASYNLRNLKDLTESDSAFDQLVGNANRPSSALVTTDIKPLSFMLGINKRSGIAITSRARVMLNAYDLDGTLGKQLADGSDDVSFPYSINSNQDMRVTANAWAEVGATYGRVIYEKGPHAVKAGVTAKYLAGVANAYVNISKLKATLTQDPTTEDVYLRDATGGLELGTAGVSLDNFEPSELTQFKSTGFGFDLGFVYEFRPDQKEGSNRRGNQYKLRVGASLTDIGAIKYEKNRNNSGGYKLDITGAEALNLEELSNQPIDGLKDYFDSKPQYFTPLNTSGDNYNVSLPTMFNLDVDYKVFKGFYVNAAANVNVAKSDATKPFNSRYYNSFTATPRIETTALGLFVPISYNELTNLNAGLAVKLGPLFFGSGSAITAVLSDAKQADFFFGIRFGSFARK